MRFVLLRTHDSYVLEKEAVKMNYLNVVIKEVLRLHPSGTLVPRKLSEDVKLNEYDIAAGTHVSHFIFTYRDKSKILNYQRFLF